MTVKAGQAYPQDSINELIIWKMNPFNSGSCMFCQIQIGVSAVFLHE